jgi:hypothetical protein
MTHGESTGCAYLKGLGHETGCKNFEKKNGQIKAQIRNALGF